MDRRPAELELAALRRDIEALRDELREGLRAILEALPRRAPGNDTKLAALLEALVVGVEVTAPRLCKAAEDRKNEKFRKAVIAIAGGNPRTERRRMGKFLRNNAGRPAGGKYFEHVRRAGDAELYRVVQVVEPTTWATLGRMGHDDGERTPRP